MAETTDIPTNFKTSLPPRKRAKTKEEKEQRRVERILRNRKAAHASREKKRKHVEFLESYVLDLEKQLHSFKELNGHLMECYQGGNDKVDSLVEKIQNLPDLNKKRHDHFMEIDAEDNEEISENSSKFLPKTPESFASSPKQNVDDQVPDLMSPESNSSMSESERSNSFMMQTLASPQTSPITNKFSLDIITGNEQSFSSPVIKTEEEEVGIDQSNNFFNGDMFIKKEDEGTQIPPLSNDIFNDKLNFGEFQVNTYDIDFGFDELRNPAVITCQLKKIKIH
ncbi:Transcriptional activator HAC1 [Wickerhamomyces ciferrii]|uniref:Transcriptional activator HAC1 n=1 Tax=Wickerhamomyces ciferrii (strain ATCC 14091 / BCRC 22168 / CBS 111 / JCM 3599 / NBRC 0793 / NRRL Y-1031 F-60-10) TaxID=1206466 RepID=K0KKL3_WICCF|nr:Transcriptional activator HAC1 [Wickerhamomyces ciferrii]CCH43526.1 Transcriptional activator HAC1 [Wickerhamomyces ciferrii]